MHTTFQNAKKTLITHEYCAIQPYLSGNPQVDLLLRNHNWAGNINTPTEIKYKIILTPTNIQKHSHGYGFWENEGRFIKDTISYASKAISEITRDFPGNFDNKYKPEYIVANEARDEYPLYECNYPSSDARITYILETQLENIKRKLHYHEDNNTTTSFMPDHKYANRQINDCLNEFKWLAKLDSIFDIETPYMNHPIYTYEDLISMFKHHINPNLISSSNITYQDISKTNTIINYVLNSATEVANIIFTPVSEGANLEFKLDVVVENCYSAGIPEGGEETFHYEEGKTIFAEYQGTICLNGQELTSYNFMNLFHECSHVLFDHPQDSVFAADYKIHDEEAYTQDLTNEYKAHSSCMSVMNTIYESDCLFQEKTLHPIYYLPIDIQALQHMYGKNENTRSGDTKYILTEKQTFINDLMHPLFNIDIPENTLYTLYDAGGTNTLDLTLVKNAIIDLNEGASHFNAIGDNIFLIAYDTNIHNVIIDSGNVKIRLNDLHNAIIVPSNGAKVEIEGFNQNEDSIILSPSIYEDISFAGCITPYSSIGDTITEICFI